MPKTPDQILRDRPHWESDYAAAQTLGLMEETENGQRRFNAAKTSQEKIQEFNHWKNLVEACKLYLKKLKKNDPRASKIHDFIAQQKNAIRTVKSIKKRKNVSFDPNPQVRMFTCQSEANDSTDEAPQTSLLQPSLTTVIPSSLFGYTNTSSNDESKQDDPLAEIKALKNQLDREIQSCWPYPNKDRKKIKSEFLNTIINAYNPSIATLHTTVKDIFALYAACKRRKSHLHEILKGDCSSRTSTLISDITNGQYNKHSFKR